MLLKLQPNLSLKLVLKRGSCMMFLILFYYSGLKAQLSSNYSFSSASGTYTSITGGAVLLAPAASTNIYTQGPFW